MKGGPENVGRGCRKKPVMQNRRLCTEKRVLRPPIGAARDHRKPGEGEGGEEEEVVVVVVVVVAAEGGGRGWGAAVWSAFKTHARYVLLNAADW